LKKYTLKSELFWHSNDEGENEIIQTIGSRVASFDFVRNNHCIDSRSDSCRRLRLFRCISPVIIGSPILAAGLGVVLSFSVESALIKGKCRNSLVITFFIILSVAFAYYLHWGFWLGANLLA